MESVQAIKQRFEIIGNDPKLNRAYAELAEHYGVLIDPARARKPRDKQVVSYCTSSGRFVGF